VILDAIEARPLRIPFRGAFKHASAERAETQTVWVTARAGSGIGHGEGCPREYVTGESLDSALAFCERHAREWRAAIHGVDDIRAWIDRNAGEVDRNPAAWCAVELALLDLLGRVEGKSVEALLGLQALGGRFRYTAVLGDDIGEQFAAGLERYLAAGFQLFKVKLSGDGARDARKVAALNAAGVSPWSVRADANNLWPDAERALRDLGALDYAFFGLEEPLAAGDVNGMARLAETLRTRIVLDESVARAGQLDRLPGPASVWIVNLRVSKMAGLLRSLAMVRALRERGLNMIVGAQVGETSVLTRAALTVAAQGRDILVAQEGAFGTHLLAHDVTPVPLMFGAGGVLDVELAQLGPHGFGIDVVSGTSADL